MEFDHTIKILSLIGGFAGFATLVWRLWDVIGAFLHTGVTVEAMLGPRVKIRTVVENSNTIARKIDAAFLMIGPDDESVDLTARHLLPKWKEKGPDTLTEMVEEISLEIKKDSSKIVDGCRMIIPLSYYYEENIDVADENLSYEQIVAVGDFPEGAYSIRFYVEARPRLHRVVHAAFEVHRSM